MKNKKENPALEIMADVKACREELSTFRKRRERCLDYHFGRQWNDLININGEWMSEAEYIGREGAIPFTNNLIRRIVRNVLGVFAKRLETELDSYSGTLKDTACEQDLSELYRRTMEEFMISGMAVHRKWFGLTDGKTRLHTDMINPDRFFFKPESDDIRGNDIVMAGMIHDVDFGKWCREFVKTPADYNAARSLFSFSQEKKRVTEVWRREKRLRYLVHDATKGRVRITEYEPAGFSSSRRAFLEDVWRYYFICENKILCCGDSPYLHKSHPFVVKCYPYLNGEIHSFVSDIIDQQRFTNRLITLYDWVIRASAKGVLLIPEEIVEPGKIGRVAEQWSRFNGVITYKAKQGLPEPKQITGSNANLGINELLTIQLKMLEDVSGVNATLQGNLAANSVSGTLYNQQTENALTSLSDLIESFVAFMRECHKKDEALLQQIL